MSRRKIHYGMGYDPEEGKSPEERRRARLVSLAVVMTVILAFAGTIWFFYAQGVKAGSNRAPTIHADEGPIRVRPDEPGGMEVPFQESLVYQEAMPNGAGPAPGGTERLLPPPEKPLPRPGAKPEAPPAFFNTSPAPADLAAAALEAVMPSPPPEPSPALEPPPAAMPAPVTPPPPPEFLEKLAMPAVPAAGSNEAPKAAMVKPGPITPNAPNPQPKPVAPASTGGDFRVQLGSLSSAQGARTEWKRLQSRYDDLLSGLSLNIETVEIKGKGTFYRVQGGLLTRARADAICKRLKTENPGGCLVVKR